MPPEKCVWQLRARGISQTTGNPDSIYSATAFTSEEIAQTRFGFFRLAVTRSSFLWALEDDETLIIKAIPLEIVE